ncbi:ATP-binding cassette domain-containing protein [Streptomyces prasinus]
MRCGAGRGGGAGPGAVGGRPLPGPAAAGGPPPAVRVRGRGHAPPRTRGGACRTSGGGRPVDAHLVEGVAPGRLPLHALHTDVPHGLVGGEPDDVVAAGQRQFVEIARALSFGARFIILDEPTAKLDARGIERLFGKLRALRRQGVAFLFISHHLQEVYDLCTTVTVYRDARHVVTAPVAELDRHALVEAMTGESARSVAPAWSVTDAARSGGEPLLEVRGLSLDGAYQDVSVTARPGEVVGLAGAAASGNVQFGETLAGLRRPRAGTVTVAGHPLRTGAVPASLAAGIGFVPEDRHLQGLIPHRSVAENATLTVTDQLGPFGTVLPSRTRAFAQRMITGLDIKTPGATTQVSALSGGNQQKVVIARALATEPHVLVAVRPTNGVDVKSKESLLGTVRDVADAGKTALIVSDELDDLRVCDRVLAMFHGRVVAEFGHDWSDEQLVAAMEGMADPTDTKDSHDPHH